MNSTKTIIFTSLIIFFLTFSFYPTFFELSLSNHLTDSNREFVLEHNYYWPDFNLYLSKIRQGWEGRFTALERYTSEKHTGSLIQEFYVVLGLIGGNLGIDPNMSYQLGRIILSPAFLILILMFVRFYFKSFWWQILAFLVIVTSGSFPRFFMDESGITHVGRFMEWWSNIDAVQRITFIPHILFGQVTSFYLLYQLAIKRWKNITMKQLIFYIVLGNTAGLVFPPSLITLNSVLILILLIKLIKNKKPSIGLLDNWIIGLFIILTLPSLLYLLVITKQVPWSSLVEFHRTHPMMIPFDQYILGTGPIIILGLFGAIISIIKKEIKFQPLILWIIVTFSFASFFSVIKEQSPLRFTQTGLFAPLGILGAYFLQQIWERIRKKELSLPAGEAGIRNYFIYCYLLFVICYLLINLFMMKVSLDWQTTFITQRAGASFPAVPYPPQTMYPLKSWMDAIRWLRNNTKREDVVLAKITAGNYIPAYAGNIVYFGQSNTVDYENKQILVDKFYRGEMNTDEALLFLQKGGVKYVFYSIQEKELLSNRKLEEVYPFLIKAMENSTTTIYSI